MNNPVCYCPQCGWCSEQFTSTTIIRVENSVMLCPKCETPIPGLREIFSPVRGKLIANDIFSDKTIEKIILVKRLKCLFDEYETWNDEGREDGLIIHTDCLNDFICWLKDHDAIDGGV